MEPLHCFEPKPKRAKDIPNDEVGLDNDNPCGVSDASKSPDGDGEISDWTRGHHRNEATKFTRDGAERFRDTLCYAFPSPCKLA